MMMAYYDMALRTFTDNVINLAIESCLIFDIPNILAPTKVNAMSPDKLAELVAETEEVQTERKLLQEQTKLLREALSKCQRHKHRELTVLPSALSMLSPNAGSRRAPWEPTPSPAPTPNGQTAQPTSTFPTSSSEAANAPVMSSLFPRRNDAIPATSSFSVSSPSNMSKQPVETQSSASIFKGFSFSTPNHTSTGNAATTNTKSLFDSGTTPPDLGYYVYPVPCWC
ncbi:hypothetical protein VTK26DRAFT_1324 [Humicola hyalothermophila]